MNSQTLLRASLLVLVAAPAWAGNPFIPPTPIGSAVGGASAQELALFNAGKAAYEHDFTLSEGRGPLFNAPACVTCHGHPVTGGSEGSTANNVTHFMINNDGNFYLALEQGGPVLQKLSIAGEPGAGSCAMSGETLPALPKVTTSHRHTPPVFGFGALDAVSDEDIYAFAGRKPYKHPSVIGAVNWSNELQGLVRLWAFTFDANRKAPSGPARAGRFGWKSQTGTLFQFTTEPFNIELGVSTPFFPRELSPDGTPVPAGHPCQKAAATPNDVGSASSIQLFHFQALIAPPAPLLPMTPRALAGKALFLAVGCADCHRPALKTVESYFMPLADGSAHRVDALSDKIIFPYSDLLIHDMGPGLEDGRIMGRASGRFWRTTPLWGIRFKSNYLHDGRTESEEEAILAHGGEGQVSTDRFRSLTRWQKDALLEFLEHL